MFSSMKMEEYMESELFLHFLRKNIVIKNPKIYLLSPKIHFWNFGNKSRAWTNKWTFHSVYCTQWLKLLQIVLTRDVKISYCFESVANIHKFSIHTVLWLQVTTSKSLLFPQSLFLLWLSMCWENSFPNVFLILSRRRNT